MPNGLNMFEPYPPKCFPGCTFVGRSTGVFLGVLAARQHPRPSTHGTLLVLGSASCPFWMLMVFMRPPRAQCSDGLPCLGCFETTARPRNASPGKIVWNLSLELLVVLWSYLVQMGVVKASRSSTTLRGENVIILSMFPSCR